MQATLAAQSDVQPWAPYRCPSCRRCDTIPMPRIILIDKLIRCAGLAPYKCRACRAKFYRRTLPKTAFQEPADHADEAPPRLLSEFLQDVRVEPQPRAASEPRQIVAVCHRDRTDTLRRVDEIIRIAASRRLPRG